MTPNDIITDVRRLIQDNQLLRTPDTYSAATLLGFVNQTLKQTAVLRPDLFSLIADISTVANTVVQSMPSDSTRLVDIFSIKNGNAITESSREILDRSLPNWTSADAGTPVNWMRHVKNPNRFFLYPRPIAGIVLVGEYVQSPPNYTLSQSIGLLPDSYLPAISIGTVAKILSIESAQNVQSAQKAAQMVDQYSTLLGVALQNRPITDTRSSGLDPRQVI